MPFQKTIMRTTFGTLKISLITVVVLSLVSCGESYEDPYGNKITKEEHERRVANDAAHDALINLLAECKASPHPGCPVQKE